MNTVKEPLTGPSLLSFVKSVMNTYKECRGV